MNDLLLVPQRLDRELATDEIHIWCARLDEQRVSQFQSLLSGDERIRAERFHFEKDRERFIIRRGILRTLLGGYSGVGANRLQFCYGKNGKPALADEFGKGKICFNSSSSEGSAIYAFTRDSEIGVDIEYMRDIPEMAQIAERIFSVKEKALFLTLPESRRKEAFFKWWTCKEAFIKAIGEGLSYPLDEIDVLLAPDEPAKLLRIEGNSEAASRWSIQDLRPASGFAAAVAIKGQNRSVHCRQWGNQY
jgi:4'-phosphopantetheinyl transferase